MPCHREAGVELEESQRDYHHSSGTGNSDVQADVFPALREWLRSTRSCSNNCPRRKLVLMRATFLANLLHLCISCYINCTSKVLCLYGHPTSPLLPSKGAPLSSVLANTWGAGVTHSSRFLVRACSCRSPGHVFMACLFADSHLHPSSAQLLSPQEQETQGAMLQGKTGKYDCTELSLQFE